MRTARSLAYLTRRVTTLAASGGIQTASKTTKLTLAPRPSSQAAPQLLHEAWAVRAAQHHALARCFALPAHTRRTSGAHGDGGDDTPPLLLCVPLAPSTNRDSHRPHAPTTTTTTKPPPRTARSGPRTASAHAHSYIPVPHSCPRHSAGARTPCRWMSTVPTDPTDQAEISRLKSESEGTVRVLCCCGGDAAPLLPSWAACSLDSTCGRACMGG